MTLITDLEEILQHTGSDLGNMDRAREAALLLANNSAGGFEEVIITLTPSQINNLGSTPVRLLDPLPPNTAYFLDSILVIYSPGSVGYNIEDASLNIAYSNTIIARLSRNIITFTANKKMALIDNFGAQISEVNQNNVIVHREISPEGADINISSSGPISNGDGTLEIRITYKTINI
jgi:hypothetical protein